MNNCRYRVAKVEWIWDTLPPEDSQEKEDVSMTPTFSMNLLY